MYLVFLLLLFVAASVAQSPTIITAIDELSFSFVKGAPAQSQNFLLVPNFRTRLLFNLKWNTPGYSPSWIVFAGTDKGNGEGEFSNGNPVTVTVRVDSTSLPIGTTIGYLYVTDSNGTGLDRIDIIAEVTPSPRPLITENGIRDAAAGDVRLSPGAWVSVYGSQLAPDTAAEGRTWQSSEIIDGQLPLSLDGVKVSIGGKNAAIAFVHNSQINCLIPSDTLIAKDVPVVVTTSSGSSPPQYVDIVEVGPGFFLIGTTRHVAAQHSDYSSVGSSNLISGGSFTPARPGETISLYATGFGRTDPPTPAGVVVIGGATIHAPVSVLIGGTGAVAKAYLSGVGLYQLQVTVPEALPDSDDHPVIVTVGGVDSQPNVVLAVRR